jgi:periplasmic protein TonB
MAPLRTTCIFCAISLAACSPKPAADRPVPAQEPAAAAPAAAPAASVIPPLTLNAYKKEFAAQIARTNPQFSEPVPEVLKSIVVLEVVIDRNGGLQRVAVRRSNGYKALENSAMDSVRRAAPFPAPAFTIRRGDGSVTFLETFLFRDDGRFRILSLQQG